MVSLVLLPALLVLEGSLGNLLASTALVEAFVATPISPFRTSPPIFTTRLLLAKKKLSMAQKRKRRGKKLPPRPVERSSVYDSGPRVDAWDKTSATGTTTDTPSQQQTPPEEVEDKNKARAAALVESQRKSVEALTHVRECVEGLPYDAIVSALNEPQGYYVTDSFLNDENMVFEMESESLSMLNDNKLELDLTYVGSGEYVTRLEGGEEQYKDCPRSIEFLVSLTRHMTPLLNERGLMEGRGCRLDEAASMGSLRVYDRKVRMDTLGMLIGKDDEENKRGGNVGEEEEVPAPLLPRPFGYANGNDEDDARKVTVLYFLTPSGWDGPCGGGVTVRREGDVTDVRDGGDNDGVLVEAKRDRLVIFRSDSCLVRMEAWDGRDEMESGSCLVTHLVKSA